MRIISGSLGGRNIKAPKGNMTHPMSDKMRGAIFNILGDIEGLFVLDAFSGTGALGIEAISRGAGKVVAIESDRDAFNTIQANIAQLGLLRHMKAVHASVSGWSGNNPSMQFDVVFCDPPYDKLQIATLERLGSHIKPAGILVLSWPGKLEHVELTGLNIVEQKNYGDSQLVFYKNN